MMKKFMKKLWEKKDSQKGFTLVELIVVLVILAILAAIMVPSLIGWINKAKEKEIILSARNAELAAQTVLYEKYVAGGKMTAVTALADIPADDLVEVTKITGTLTDVKLQWKHDDKGIITGFAYIQTGGKTATYDGSSWKISDTTTS